MYLRPIINYQVPTHKATDGHIYFFVYICQIIFYYNSTSMMDLIKIKFCNIVKLLMGHVNKNIFF